MYTSLCFINNPAPTVICPFCHTLSLHDAIPISLRTLQHVVGHMARFVGHRRSPSSVLKRNGLATDHGQALQKECRRERRPCTTHELAMHLMASRNMNTADKRLVKTVQKRVGAALRHYPEREAPRPRAGPGGLAWGEMAQGAHRAEGGGR